MVILTASTLGLSSALRRFYKCDDGNIALSAALCVTVLGLAVGCAVDYMNASATRSRMQGIADAAALAAAHDTNLSNEIIEAEARKFIQANKDSSLPIDMRVSVDTEHLPDSSIVSVKLGGEVSTSFLRIAEIDSIGVSVLAVAKKAKYPVCIYALDPSSSGSFRVTGSGDVSAPNCAIQVNSESTDALIVSGSGALEAGSIRVTGGYDARGHYSPTPLTQQQVLADPLRSLPEPEMPRGCNYRDHTFSTPAILPANRVYCGDIKFRASVTFQPGIHFFKNANLRVVSDAKLLGAGVMLYFGPDSSFDQAAGNGGLAITPMTNGVYKGISVFASRDSSTHPLFRFLGNESLSIAGTMYMPAATLEMTGSSDLSVLSLTGKMIAWNFLFSGNSALRFEGAGVTPDIFKDIGVTLIK